MICTVLKMIIILDVYVRTLQLVQCVELDRDKPVYLGLQLQGTSMPHRPTMLLPIELSSSDWIMLQFGHGVNVSVRAGKSVLLSSESPADMDASLLLSLLQPASTALKSLACSVLTVSELLEKLHGTGDVSLATHKVSGVDIAGNAVFQAEVLLKASRTDENVVPFLVQQYGLTTVVAGSHECKEHKAVQPPSNTIETASTVDHPFQPPLLAYTASSSRETVQVLMPASSNARPPGLRQSAIASRLVRALKHPAASIQKTEMPEVREPTPQPVEEQTPVPCEASTQAHDLTPETEALTTSRIEYMQNRLDKFTRVRLAAAYQKHLRLLSSKVGHTGITPLAHHSSAAEKTASFAALDSNATMQFDVSASQSHLPGSQAADDAPLDVSASHTSHFPVETHLNDTQVIGSKENRMDISAVSGSTNANVLMTSTIADNTLDHSITGSPGRSLMHER